jgi:hypothetical protein
MKKYLITSYDYRVFYNYVACVINNHLSASSTALKLYHKYLRGHKYIDILTQNLENSTIFRQFMLTFRIDVTILTIEKRRCSDD